MAGGRARRRADRVLLARADPQSPSLIRAGDYRADAIVLPNDVVKRREWPRNLYD